MNCFKWFIWILSPIKFSKNLGLPMCQYNASISESRRLGPLCKEDFPMVRYASGFSQTSMAKWLNNVDRKYQILLTIVIIFCLRLPSVLPLVEITYHVVSEEAFQLNVKRFVKEHKCILKIQCLAIVLHTLEILWRVWKMVNWYFIFSKWTLRFAQ